MVKILGVVLEELVVLIDICGWDGVGERDFDCGNGGVIGSGGGGTCGCDVVMLEVVVILMDAILIVRMVVVADLGVQ